jgi:hypothetical protein
MEIVSNQAGLSSKHTMYAEAKVSNVTDDTVPGVTRTMQFQGRMSTRMKNLSNNSG